MKWILVFLAMSLTLEAAEKLMNELSEQEEKAGYELLFNGKDLNKWRSYKKKEASSAWAIKKQGDVAMIEVVPAASKDHIFTKVDTFQNFDFKVEWNVPKNGNSGIFIRYMESQGAWAGNSGPEAQVVDISHYDGKQPLHKAGVCYDMFPLLPGKEEWFNPTDEWNEFRIIAFDKKVAHYGNGQRIIEYEWHTDEWDKAYTRSKYGKLPWFNKIHPGAIYIQHHGEYGIKYRNIRIKPLKGNENPWQAGSEYLAKGAKHLVESLDMEAVLFPPVVSTKNAHHNTQNFNLEQTANRIKVGFPSKGDYKLVLQSIHGRRLGAYVVENAEQFEFDKSQLRQGVIILQIKWLNNVIQKKFTHWN